MRLFELGASAGLNLQLDRYRLRSRRRCGRAGRVARSLLKPEWKGPPPPGATVRIVGRAGVDLNPVDPAAATTSGCSLMSGPTSRERLAPARGGARHRRGAIRRAVEQGDAADWLEAKLAVEPEPGVCRVVMHSVAFQYFPAEAQAADQARLIEAAGARAQRGRAAGLAAASRSWPADAAFSLRLRTWPGEDALLAWTHPHGSSWMVIDVPILRIVIIASAPARR